MIPYAASCRRKQEVPTMLDDIFNRVGMCAFAAVLILAVAMALTA